MQWSDIEWTDATWNPTHGCTRVSSGCDNCYAEQISRQYGHTEHPWEPEHADVVVQTKPEKLEEPYSWPARSPVAWAVDAPGDQHPCRVFVNSMSDLFHSAIDEDFIRRVVAVMRNRPEHIFQVLTKRPGRAAHLDIDWPANVWLGTSVEDDDVAERIDLLRDADAATLFVSFEPLIGPVGGPIGAYPDLEGIDWAIVGGESGPAADRRPMDHAWARAIRDACREQDVAFFFKQSSGRHHGEGRRLQAAGFTDEAQLYEEFPALPEPTRRTHRNQEFDRPEVTASAE